jgi:hypothetical protein
MAAELRHLLVAGLALPVALALSLLVLRPLPLLLDGLLFHLLALKVALALHLLVLRPLPLLLHSLLLHLLALKVALALQLLVLNSLIFLGLGPLPFARLRLALAYRLFLARRNILVRAFAAPAKFPAILAAAAPIPGLRTGRCGKTEAKRHSQ